MPYTLELPTSFLGSTAAPERCVFSGHPTHGPAREVTVWPAIPLWLVVAAYFFVLPLVVLLPRLFRDRIVSLPAAEAGLEEWKARRRWPWLPLVAGWILAGLCLANADPGPSGSTLAYALACLCVYGGMGAAALLHVKLGRDQLKIVLQDQAAGVILFFPDHHSELFEQYRQAYEAWRKNAAAIDPAPRRRLEEDSYVAEIPGGWDRSTAAARQAGAEARRGRNAPDLLEPPPPDLSATE